MKCLCIFIASLFVISTLAENDKSVVQPTLPTITPPTTTRMTTTTTTTTTEAPTPKPTPPKPKPTPPPKPTSTTPQPTSPQPTSPTPKPEPSTTPVPSTTVGPVTTPAPKEWDWEVEVDGQICILAKMNINVELKVKGEQRDTHYQIPNNATSSGSCGAKEQSISLEWPENNLLAFWFKMDNKSHHYFVEKVVANITDKDGKSYSFERGDLKMYETKSNSSYSCSYSVPIVISSNTTVLTINLSDIKVEAFYGGNQAKPSFGTVMECPPDSPDLVPILVGAGLTLLIVAVLIAYLISRRRSQARGYTSM